MLKDSHNSEHNSKCYQLDLFPLYTRLPVHFANSTQQVVMVMCVCVWGGGLTFYVYNLGFIIFDHHFCGGFRKITFFGGRCFFHFIW